MSYLILNDSHMIRIETVICRCKDDVLRGCGCPIHGFAVHPDPVKPVKKVKK